MDCNSAAANMLRTGLLLHDVDWSGDCAVSLVETVEKALVALPAAIIRV